MDEPPSIFSVDVIDQSDFKVDNDLIIRAVVATFALEKAQPSDVRVLLCSDELIIELNKRFRGIDETTDVLTFPEDAESNSGDIAISMPVALSQGSARGISLTAEVALLAIHGSLHLLGWDDIEDDDRNRMVDRMMEIASAVDLPQPKEWGSLVHSDLVGIV